jgi:DNA gyrase subunit A
MDRFSLSRNQTDHILDMPLKRLTALETRRLEEEREELEAEIGDFKQLLKSETRRRTLVVAELSEAVEAFGRPRRTEIVHPDDLPVFDTTEVAEGYTRTPRRASRLPPDPNPDYHHRGDVGGSGPPGAGRRVG